MTPGLPMADPQLPGLALALDDAHMAGVFNEAWRPAGLSVLHCTRERVKYRPGRSASLGYRLDVRSPRGEAELRAGARLGPSGDAARRHERHVSSRQGPPPFVDPALGLFAWAVPDDPKLDALAVMLDPAIHETALRRKGLTVQLVQYVPETRACVRVSGKDGPIAYAKLDPTPGGIVAACSLMFALAASPAARQGRLRAPRVLAADPGRNLLWLSALPGKALLDCHPICPPEIARRLGAQLAAFHALDVRPDRPTPADTWSQGERRTALADPALGRRLDAVLARLDAKRPKAGPAVCLHGDLHPRNILLDGSQPALIDLESAHPGPAWLDLGSWAADCLLRASLAGQPAAAALASLEAFLQGYAQGGGDLPANGVLAWACAQALAVERIHRCFSALKEGRLAHVPMLLGWAETLLARGDLFALAEARS